MSRPVARLLAFGALAAGAACVEIATGPNGVVAITLPRVPKAIILGDTLRDSSGTAIRLQPIGYGENGAPVSDLAFRFASVPISRDTIAAKPIALLVDTATGLVRADSTWRDDSGRVAITLGDRLQILDTFVVVPRPTRLTRPIASGDSVVRPDTSTLFYDCRNVGTALERDVLPDTIVRVYRRAAYGTVTPLAARVLTGDSAGTTIPVRRYLVEYTIDSIGGHASLKIPTTTLPNGATRAVIGLIAHGATATATPDGPIRFDTTDATGSTSPRLRIFPTALTNLLPATTDTLVKVFMHALVRTSPTRTVVDTLRSVVTLRRFVLNPADATPLSCPAP